MENESIEQGEKKEEKELGPIMLGGREVDLNNALPLKLRDWRKLEKDGITSKAIEGGAMEATFKLAFYVLKKADPAVTEDEVDDLTLPELKRIIEGVNKERTDRPS